MENDEKFMREALAEARIAADEGEVPVGAVVVARGRVIARGHNMTERLADPTAHAEMIALTAATEALGGKYLSDCALYVTLEPCPMCAGAILNGRVRKVYYGARDRAMGACGGVFNLFMENFPNKTAIQGGIMEKECREILSAFFASLRDGPESPESPQQKKKG